MVEAGQTQLYWLEQDRLGTYTVGVKRMAIWLEETGGAWRMGELAGAHGSLEAEPKVVRPVQLDNCYQR